MLTLLRHGQSAWNLEDRCTGWTDVDLTQQGREEAPTSFRDAEAQVMPCRRDVVVPQLRAGLSVLVVAHGNSLRELVKNLEGISDRDIENAEIATGRPVIYRLDEGLGVREKEVL